MYQFTAADGLVLTMLGVMLLSFGVVAMLLHSIRKSMCNRNLPVEELIEEVAMEAAGRDSTPLKVTEARRQPWEKDGDWWRNE